jgi:hypothetical protein
VSAEAFPDSGADLTPAQRQALIERSGLFDRAYYLAHNPDVASSIYDPFDHYVRWGGDENRAPSDKFDPAYYAGQCELAKLNPRNRLLHYLTEGGTSGFFATPLEQAMKRTGMTVFELAQKFESWGRDCELGLVQRRLGVDPAGLFRFSDPTPEILADLVRSNFSGYAEHAYIALDDSRPRREWFFIDPETRTSRHTQIFEGDMPRDMIQKAALFWAQLLREKTVREIAAGEKIFVIKSSESALNPRAVEDLARALRSKGPGWLVWVEARPPVGHCEIAMDGLVRACIDRLCPPHQEQEFSLVGWVTVLCEAWNAVGRRHVDP